MTGHYQIDLIIPDVTRASESGTRRPCMQVVLGRCCLPLETIDDANYSLATATVAPLATYVDLNANWLIPYASESVQVRDPPILPLDSSTRFGSTLQLDLVTSWHLRVYKF